MTTATQAPPDRPGFFQKLRETWAVIFYPETVKQNTFREMARILDQADWSDPPPADRLDRLRIASDQFLRPGDLPLVQAVLADRRPLPEVARALGRDPAEVERALADFHRFAAAAGRPA